MRGLLFTELIEMMEDLMGLEFANKVIAEAQLENQGAYTAIGNYPHKDLFKLLGILSSHAQNPQNKVIKSYGEYLFFRLCTLYPEEVKKYPNTFALLKEIPIILDRETRKLEPNAEVPDIKINIYKPDFMELTFNSKKRMGFLLEGWITACISHYQEPISFIRNDIDPEGMKVRFILLKRTGNERN